MRALLMLMAFLPVFASASTLDKETKIKKWVQLRIAIAQSDYCNNEFNKLQSKSETPFMLNQQDPASTNKRFSENKLTIEEEIAYKEFTNFCAASFAAMMSLGEELKGGK